jgi:arginine decarboxylase
MRNRIPYEFFETKGIGESDLEIHAGSFHEALGSAGIADFNIVRYSSILPKEATLISYEDYEKLKMPFGSELFCIMSECSGQENQLLTAGIVYGFLYDNDTDEKIGGLVCEIQGSYEEEIMKTRLEKAINKLRIATYSDYYLGDLKFIISSFSPTSRYGTAISALCFVSYLEGE